MLEMLSMPFMQRALIAVLVLAVVCGVFGVFVIMRRMSFFADAIAHSSLAGIALGTLIGISPQLSTLVAAILVALLIAFLSSRTKQSLDTVVGIAYALALSVGVMILSASRGLRTNINTYLFGDILSVDWNAIAMMSMVTVFVLAALFVYWRPFVLMSIQANLASVQGIRTKRMELVYMLLLAAVVAAGIRVAGIILIGPMLIIPAATAKNVARSLRETVGLSVIFAMLASMIGLFGSYVLNVPSGPSIIVVSSLLFFASLMKV